ncbi:CRISPR-associated ring nuclease Csm6 [Pseudomonas sp. AN-1]|uniref:CRISPR-associated ring nuclease Csm6 n=1 Tax=Pseudomonas sp. AN-1 TaxID=3096605 RepID=UPI002A6AB295|nr:CRISPR-associated ring nuclease Csm6 [Pseudomonas sp. AN-1]WPP46942.1 CRISPR-associated ring nuclease Csm6 [Pseudomonas sp. AN-1]
MGKHILLATTGESPQVVTETLYAIHKEGLTWPDEIRLVTTTVGKARAEKGLLDEGHLARLCDEIARPQPAFDTGHIEVVPGAKGQDVDDARSLEDHEALANFIMTRVRDLTADDQQTVHASLAGGRKTMTFYLGYAMSLFGRRQDSLSHVLISKGYESLRDFWYPSLKQGQLHGYDGKPLFTADGMPLMPGDAEVTLAPIPFVRHRHDLPELLPQSGGAVHFRELVRLINLGELPEELCLRIDLPEQTIIVSDMPGSLSFTFKPGLLALAFYAVMARATLEGKSTLYRPSGEYARAAGEVLRDLVLRELLALHEQPASASLETSIQSLRGLFKDSTLNALLSPLTYTWFDQRKSELSKLFKEKLTERVSNWLTPELIWDDAGERLDQTGKAKGGGYGIPLPVGSITLVEIRERDAIS